MDDLTKSHVKGHMRGKNYVRPYDRDGASEPLAPHHHPKLNDAGKPVLITDPHHASAPSTWDNADAVATFVPGGDVPLELNGIPLRRWRDHPTTVEGWDYCDGIMDDLVEPPFVVPKGKHPSAGVVIEEKDGRVWVVHPTNQFGSYEATWPKGTVDAGMCLQASACKEAMEESGLKVRITGFIGDYERTTSVARMYSAVRVSGSPTEAGWESQAVSLIPRGLLFEHLNGAADHPIAEAIGASPAPKQKSMV